MHPRIAELVHELESARAELRRAVAQVAPERRDVRPAPDAWSVADVLDHLWLVEDGSARLLARRLLRAREQGLGPETETVSVLGALAAFDLVESPVRRTAPDLTAPRPEARAASALAALEASRAALLDVLREGDGLALGDVTARHLALGELNVYQWALFVAQHERRHARQIARLAD